MHLMRCLFLLTAVNQLLLAPMNLPGRDNAAADHLLRNTFQSFLHFVPKAEHARPSRLQAGLDITSLEERSSFYFANGLASSSQRTKSGENRYLRFCSS
jgi:hypothetical protein